MAWTFNIAPREALAAPTSNTLNNIQSAVILVVSILSALGAGWIMLSFAVRPHMLSTAVAFG